jgi:alpha-beta hydrolase superfamily lysophospholipase
VEIKGDMALPTAVSESPEQHRKQREALWRAVPVTRMVDYGVPLGDAQSVHALTSEPESHVWDVVCEILAQRHADLAEHSEAAGRMRTAAQAWRASFALLQCAQLAYNEDVPRKVDLYERSHTAVRRYARLCHDLSHFELASTAGALYGWMVQPAREKARGAVLVMGGLSGWGAAYLDMARALTARGLTAILVEGPGQGMVRLRHGVHMTAETLPLLSAFVDLAADHGAGRFGVWGNSFGGLFAARLAAHDARLQATCVNGAPPVPEVPSFRTAREQMAAAFGTRDDMALAARLQSLAVDAARHRTAGSVLVVQGGRDPLLPLGAQDAFLSLAAPGRGATLTWQDGQHTIYNHAQERNARVADWFAEQLHE